MLEKNVLHSKTFRRLFLSYFLLLLVLIVIIATVSFSNYAADYRENINRKSQEDVDRISYLVESQLLELRNINTRIQKLSWVNKYYAGWNMLGEEFSALRKKEITSEISLYVGSGTTIQELALLFPAQDTVVSPNGWTKISEYLSMRRVSDTAVQNQIINRIYHGKDLTELPQIEEAYQYDGRIVISCPVEQIAEPRVYSIFIINKQWLMQSVLKNMPSNLCSFCIYAVQTQAEVLSVVQNSPKTKKTSITVKSSGFLDWNYEFVFDDSLNGIPANQLYSQMLLFCGILVLGFLLSGLIAMLTYRPIGRLVHRVSTQQPMESSDYNAIEQAFDRLEHENFAMQLNLEQLQTIKLDYFHLQIRPHFFLNCLNIVYNMAQLKNYASIQRFILVISDYMRYLFANDMNPVRVKEEVEHIRKYLEIQEIRRLSPANYTIEAEPETEDFLIPPLLLQTFVENAVKSIQISNRENSSLEVRVKTAESPDGTILVMTVEDNGIGFSSEVLQSLDRFETVPQENGRRRIGIQNSIQRLKLMYEEKVQISFSNKESGGAMVSIRIPEARMKK